MNGANESLNVVCQLHEATTMKQQGFSVGAMNFHYFADVDLVIPPFVAFTSFTMEDHQHIQSDVSKRSENE